MLIAYKTETATQFHYKGCDFLNKTAFQLQLLQWLNCINESEIITATEYLIGIIGLLSWLWNQSCWTSLPLVLKDGIQTSMRNLTYLLTILLHILR